MNLSNVLKFKIRGHMNGIKYPCIVDIKYDGIPVLVHCKAGNPIELELENGSKFTLVGGRAGSDKNHKSGIFLAEWIVEEGKNNDLHKLLSEKAKKEDPEYDSNLHIFEPTSIRVFDVITLDGEDYTQKSLTERKLVYAGSSSSTLALCIVAENEAEVMAFFKKAVDNGYEGVVVKNLNETFEQQTWVKIKKEDTITLPVSATVSKVRFEVDHGGKKVGIAYNTSVPCGTLAINDLVEIKHNGITKSGSLRNPIAVRIVHANP